MVRLIAPSIAIAVAATLVGEGTLLGATSPTSTRQAPSVAPDFIDTSIENGSPFWYEVVDNVVRIHLLYDHERVVAESRRGSHSFRAARTARQRR